MALTASWPGPTNLTTTTDARKNLAGLIAKDTAGVARSGIFPAHTNALVTARSDMNIDIAAFTGAAVQFGGPVLICNDAVAQLPAVLVSPGAGTNYYVIYAKQNESTSPGTDANNNRVFGAQLSTTSLAVARAALPAGALELATVEMPTGKTATNQSGVIITPTFPYTAVEGGVVLLRNQSEQNAWAPHDGSPAFRLDTDRAITRIDGTWMPVRPAFFANRGSAQSLSPAGWWVISTAFAAPVVNDLGAWTGANGTLQVAHAGIYRVGGFVKLAVPSNPMSLQITQNSSAPDTNVIVESFPNSSVSSLNASALVSLNAGDVIRLLVFNSTATTVAGAQLSLELVQYI